MYYSTPQCSCVKLCASFFHYYFIYLFFFCNILATFLIVTPTSRSSVPAGCKKKSAFLFEVSVFLLCLNRGREIIALIGEVTCAHSQRSWQHCCFCRQNDSLLAPNHRFASNQNVENLPFELCRASRHLWLLLCVRSKPNILVSPFFCFYSVPIVTCKVLKFGTGLLRLLNLA